MNRLRLATTECAWEAVREHSGGQPFGGAGEYAWIRNGKLVAIEPGWPATPDELVERTDEYFEE